MIETLASWGEVRPQLGVRRQILHEKVISELPT